MAFNEPQWWYDERAKLIPALLSPAAWLYERASFLRRKISRPYRPQLPVICVGNFTAGGTGKTPTSILVCSALEELGYRPWMLSRGYGGQQSGPLRVESGIHSARAVGDEPLLLARSYPTVVARDRRAGASFIEQHAPANAVIVMDDGLQNPSLVKDLSLAVISASRAIGNGRVIPAGPLRLPLEDQLKLVDALIINGDDERADTLLDAVVAKQPRFHVLTVPIEPITVWQGQRFLAFAGIADPERFFNALRAQGAEVVQTYAQADHRHWTANDAERLLAEAHRLHARLVTTAKDMARLHGVSGSLASLVEMTRVFEITLEIPAAERETFKALLQSAIDKRARDT